MLSRRWARFTVSPTSVYSRRSSLPRRAAATSPDDRPMPEAERLEALRLPLLVDLALALVHAHGGPEGSVGVVVLRERGAEHRHHRVAHVLHDRALLAEDGVFISRRWVRSWPARVVGSVCSAMPE